MGANFPRSLRLLTAKQFQNVFNKPKKIYLDDLTILFKITHYNHPRLGFAVSKKKVPKANIRNTIKRIVRESFRLQKHQFKHIDVVVLAKNRLLTVDKIKLRKDIDALWVKLKNYCEKGSSH